MSADHEIKTPTVAEQAAWLPEIITTTPSVRWPAIPGAAGAARLAGLYQLDQSQWLSADAIREKQLGELQGLLQHALKTVPFYQKHYVQADIQPGQPLDRERWQALPLLTRTDIQHAGESLLSQAVPKRHGDIGWTQTSGSTGEPVRVASTGLTSYLWNLFTLRNHQWHRRRLKGKLAAIRYLEGKTSPKGQCADTWGAATQGLFNTGPSATLHIGFNAAQQAEWLLKTASDYLLTYPSNLLALTNWCRQHEIRLPNLREVQTVGEIVTPSMRRACEDAWGVPLTDMYTTQEFGYIALQCPDHEHYHVQAENVLVEVLDEDGAPCEPGQTGRLVISSLHNFATPLLRYEIGDHAQVGPACDCGRGLPVLTRILGRTRNMLVLPSGERRWPLLGWRRFREIAPVSQYQFVQKSPAHLLARLVVETPLEHAQEQALLQCVRDSLGHPFEIEVEYLERIPRGNNGKYEEFICEVDSATADPTVPD